jgi:hypothetical protein
MIPKGTHAARHAGIGRRDHSAFAGRDVFHRMEAKCREIG